MHVVVVGCGRVGAGLARALEESGHTVAVVDRRAKAFERLPEASAAQTIVGVGFDRDRLKAAGIEEAGALAAVTNGDNSNILVARVARETFGIERVVARIYDPRRAKIYERLGIPTIATVEWATERVLQRILPDRPTVRLDRPQRQGAARRAPGARRPGPASKVGDARRRSATPASPPSPASARARSPDPTPSSRRATSSTSPSSGDSIDEFDQHLAGGPRPEVH